MIKPSVFVLLLTGVLTGCTSLTAGVYRLKAVELPDAPSQSLGQCQRLLHAVHDQARARHLQDAQTQPLLQAAQFRVDRTLSAFDLSKLTQAQQQVWGLRAKAEAREGLENEMQRLNLPFAEQQRVLNCLNQASHLPPKDLSLPTLSAYQPLWRKASLHRLTDPLLLVAIKKEQDKIQHVFAKDTHYTLPVRRYQPRVIYSSHKLDDPPEIAPPFERDAIGLPVLNHRQSQALARRFAPTIEVAHADDSDRLLNDENQATVHWLQTQTRIGQRWHIQLVYQWLYPARATQDLASGRFDGLIWRVTLDKDDNSVLLYDSIHPCGCYHRVYSLADKPLVRKRADRHTEQPLFHTLDVPSDQALRVRVSHGEHFVSEVGLPTDRSINPLTSFSYRLAPYHQLRHLNAEQSAFYFDGHGLVPGSQRHERWLLGHHGVRSPGSLRQWGTHAISFVGERHFDEADFFEQWFDFGAPLSP